MFPHRLEIGTSETKYPGAPLPGHIQPCGNATEVVQSASKVVWNSDLNQMDPACWMVLRLMACIVRMCATSAKLWLMWRTCASLQPIGMIISENIVLRFKHMQDLIRRAQLGNGASLWLQACNQCCRTLRTVHIPHCESAVTHLKCACETDDLL